MADEVVADKSMTHAEADKMKASLELDLVAFFREMQDDMLRTVESGMQEGRTADEIISDVERLLNE